MTEEARYRFVGEPPRGFFLGMTIAQLSAIAAAGGLVVALVNTVGAVAIVAAFPIGAVTLFVAFWKRAGLTLLEWAPSTAVFAVARVVGRQEFRAAPAGHLLALRSGPEGKEPPEASISLPAELADVEIVSARLPRFGGVEMGVAYDRRAVTFTAVVRCEPRGFYLLSPPEQEYALACWGGCLAMFAREGSPVRRIAWYERALPPSSNELLEHLHAARRPDISDDDLGMRAMWELLEAHGTGTVDHEVLVALQIDLKRGAARAAAAKLGEEKAGACALLAEETSLLVDQLTAMAVMGNHQAGVRSPAIPSPTRLAKLLRDGIDPFSRRTREMAPAGQEQPGIGAEDFGPGARQACWGHVRTDGALHAIGRVSRWPARDVRSSFLQPLMMMTADVTRTVAMVMEVLPPEKARRAVERRALSAEGDQAVRSRFGKRQSARSRLAEEAILQHERELAVGHADVSFAAYVAVSVAEHRGVAALERDFSVVQSAALGAGLQLDRCWGTQAQALTFILPLGRGLA